MTPGIKVYFTQRTPKVEFVSRCRILNKPHIWIKNKSRWGYATTHSWTQIELGIPFPARRPAAAHWCAIENNRRAL